MSQESETVRSRSRTSCCSQAKIKKPPPPPPTFKPPPLPEEEDSIFIRPITRTRSPNHPELTSSEADMPQFLSAKPGSSASSSRSVSPVYKITHDSFIDGKNKATNEVQGLKSVTTSSNVELEKQSFKNGHQESSKLSKESQETEKHGIQSVSEKKHPKEDVQQTPIANHTNQKERNLFKSTTKSMSKTKEKETRVEVVEEPFVDEVAYKTTNGTSKLKNKAVIKETKKPDIPLAKEVVQPNHTEETNINVSSLPSVKTTRTEVIEEPFIEEVAYKTTNNNNSSLNQSTEPKNESLKEVGQQAPEPKPLEEKNILSSSNIPITTDNSVEVIEQPFVEEVAYKTSTKDESSRDKVDSLILNRVVPEMTIKPATPTDNRVEVIEEPFVEELAYKTSAKDASSKEKVNSLILNRVVPEMTIEPATPPINHSTSKVVKDDLVNPTQNSDNDEGYPTEIFPPQIEKQMKKKKKKKLVEMRRVKKDKIAETDDKGWPKQTQNSMATNEDIPIVSRSGSESSPIIESRTDTNKALVSTNNASNEHLANSSNVKTNSFDVKPVQDIHQEVNKLEETSHAGQSNVLIESQTDTKNDLDRINGDLIEKVDKSANREHINDVPGLTLTHNNNTTESNENRIEVIEEPFVETFAYTTTSNGLGEQTKIVEEPFIHTSAYKTTEQRIEFVDKFPYKTNSDKITNENAVGDAIENVKVPFGKTITTDDKEAFIDVSSKSELSPEIKSKALANSIESLPFLKTHDNIADLTVETIQDYFSKHDGGKSEEEDVHTDQKNITQPLHPQEHIQEKTTSKVLSIADSDPEYCKLAEKKPTVLYGDSKLEMKSSTARPLSSTVDNKQSTAPPPPPPPPKTPKFNKDNQETVTEPQSVLQDEPSQRRQRQKPLYESKKEKQIAQIKEFLKSSEGDAKEVKLPQVRLKQKGADKDSLGSVLTCLTPHLYLATSRAVSEANLPQHGITCVISAGPIKEGARKDGVEVVSVIVADDQDLPNHFTIVAERLEKERAKGGKTVVHSGSDCTHAALLSIAWMVKYGGKSMDEASQMVKEKRPGARLANGMFLRLQEWQKGAGGKGWGEVATSWLPMLVYLLLVFLALKFMFGALIKIMGGEREEAVNSNLYDYFDVYKWP